MKLLIDIGNTRIKWMLVGDQLVVKGFDDDWSELEKHQGDILSVWISCVGKRSTLAETVKRVKALCCVEPNVASVTTKLGLLVNQYKDLDRLGVDRWVVAVGARALHANGNLIIVDAGTAVTIDCVDAEHNYLGGAILPGFAMMHDSLVGRTAGISSQRQEVLNVIGENTQECVNSGAHFGLVGAIERVVSEIRLRLRGGHVTLLITGGDAEVVVAASCLPFSYQANLLFDGLICLSEQSLAAKNTLSSVS